MDRFLEINVIFHIVSGFVAVACFWVQIISRKGSRLHVLTGRVFVFAGGFVALAAAASICLRAWRAYENGMTLTARPDEFQIGSLLLYISIMVLMFLWAGVVLARQQARQAPLPLFGIIIRSGITIVSTGLLAVYAWVLKPSLWPALLVAAGLGVNAVWDQVKLLFHRAPDPEFRLGEHITNVFGAGLAYHVAFILLGSERFFDIWQWGTGVPIAIIATAIVAGIVLEKDWKRRVQRKAPSIS